MTQTLQDALLKAGLVTAEKLKRAQQDQKAAQRAHQRPPIPTASPRFQKPVSQGRTEEGGQNTKPSTPPASAKRPDFKPRPKPTFSRPAPETKGPGFLEHKHIHHLRTDCDSCQRSSPDVEYYEHPNKSFQHYWLCVRCADEHNILDQFRQTKQSQHAMSGIFRRNYGPTKIFR
ncbi:MAG: hypothetical protein IPJ69_15005 [Deltaproteobacteria bacterium]|nr:MAG: hypothetical protein IPJ69_15005 [Deltaproteobacteria bacterium]